MVRPVLGDLELEQVQRVETWEDQVVTRHPIPGLEGDFLQDLGRRGAQLRLTGVLTAAETLPHLAELRTRFHAGDPVGFVSDISTATIVDRVLIESMAVRERAGRPQAFEYDFVLREFTEAEPIDTEDIDIPPPEQPDVETGKLAVTVVVEGDSAFDMDRVKVSVHGTEERTGADLSRLLTNRTRPDTWFEDPFPAGDYTVEALVDDTATPTGQREVLTGSASVRVVDGPVSSVTIVLRRGAKVGTVFVITFRFDSAFVEPCMRHVLQQVAKHSADHADEHLLLVGHTDLVGPPSYNQALSERRGRATYAMLTFGHDPQRSIAEWNELRRARPAGQTTVVKDTWGTREIQHILQDLGLYKGNVDKTTGEDASLTDAAIRQFQRDHDLADDGVVGDGTWPVLIEAYLGREPLDIPADRFLPNKNAAGCDNGPLRWIGCGEQDPVRNVDFAWRPNRRSELMFVHEPEMLCQVAKPVTLDLVPDGAGGGGWCLDDGTASAVDCFVVPIDPPPQGPPPPNQWKRTPAEPGSFPVTGTITFEDGTPFADGLYALTASDGEYMNDEVKATTGGVHAGTPIAGRTDGAGNLVHAPTASSQKGPGTFSVAVDGPFLARTREQTIADAKGNAVCFRLDGSKPADIIIVNRAVASMLPSITGPDAVVVRKPHTNPARQRVVLRASAAFAGSGTFTVSSGAIRFFDAAAGGNEIVSGTVFTSAQLAGTGHTIFAEGRTASVSVGDVVLTLQLTVGATAGLSAAKPMTAVELTLDIAALPDPAGNDRGDLSAADKANPGRFLQQQTLALQSRRARVTVRPPQPAAFAGALVLRRLSAGVDMFATEPVTAADVALGAEFPVPSPVPAAGTRVFAQGTTVSANPRDTGFQLGLVGGEPDGDRVATTVATIEVIRADNTGFPVTGDDACHMVSKFVTSADLPDVATFDGPVPANADPDTFRVQVRGLPPGTAAVARVAITRPPIPPGTNVYTQDFPMLQSAAGALRSFRSDEHVRLVSNAVDDAHLAHQTARVRLADEVAAIVLVGGGRLGALTLPVGRPPAENGPKAIRTVDVNFITLRGVASNPGAVVDTMSENWAQVAVRFSLVGQQTVDPVRNVLSVDLPAGGTAPANGSLTVDITPAGAAAATRVIALVAAGDNDQVIAQKLAAQISTNAGLVASVHRHDQEFLVMVNRGTNVGFANLATTVAGLAFTVPPLNFTDDITLIEGTVLGINFADAAPSTIDIVGVPNIPILPPRNLLGATGGDFLLANLPGWHNLSVIQQQGVDGTAARVLVAGHEMGHALMDGGDAIHARAAFQLPTSPIATNLFQPFNTADTIGGAKRLDAEQNTRARAQSGPATVPPLLNQR